MPNGSGRHRNVEGKSRDMLWASITFFIFALVVLILWWTEVI